MPNYIIITKTYFPLINKVKLVPKLEAVQLITFLYEKVM